MTIRTMIRWDDAAIATVDAVLALRMQRPESIRAEIALRLGAPMVSDHQLRNAYARLGRRFSYAVEPSSQPHTARGIGPAEVEPPTQRSERVPTVPPQPSGRVEVVETACRAFVAPMVREPVTGPRGLTGVERILLIPDCHFPYIDRRAWDCMIKAARDFKPDTIAQLGDLIDCYSVSAHDKNPERKEKLEDEIAVTNEGLDELDALGATRKIFVEGNHSMRVAKLAAKLPALHGMFVSLRDRLRFDQRGWEFYKYRKTAKIGTLALVHDVGEAGKYAAMRARDAYEGDVVIGHVHQMAVTYSGSAKTDMHVGACLGWLGAPIAAEDYMPDQKIKRHWMTGFGIAYRCLQTDRVTIVPVPIFGGRCIVEGRVYQA